MVRSGLFVFVKVSHSWLVAPESNLCSMIVVELMANSFGTLDSASRQRLHKWPDLYRAHRYSCHFT